MEKGWLLRKTHLRGGVYSKRRRLLEKGHILKKIHLKGVLIQKGALIRRRVLNQIITNGKCFLFNAQTSTMPEKLELAMKFISKYNFGIITIFVDNIIIFI